MKYVKINSTITIVATSGLQYDDFTIRDSDLPNRMKIAPTWTKMLIKQGVHKCPADVAEWPTVKALAKQGVLTINEIIEEDEEEQPQPVQEEKPHRRRKVENVSLEEVAGE